MKIKIISIQRHAQKEITVLEEEYLKRLGASVKVELVNIKPKTDAHHKEKTVKQEEKLILNEIGDRDVLILLDEGGEEFTTEGFAALLEKNQNQGTKKIVFLIGGPQGVSDVVKSRAGTVWSLSQLTFPHRLVRLLVIEALYRSLDLLKGGAYHKQ